MKAIVVPADAVAESDDPIRAEQSRLEGTILSFLYSFRRLTFCDLILRHNCRYNLDHDCRGFNLFLPTSALGREIQFIILMIKFVFLVV